MYGAHFYCIHTYSCMEAFLAMKILDIFQIHLINLLGTKKRDSIQDRLDYANSILPDIIDSAEKPLKVISVLQYYLCHYITTSINHHC